MKKFLFLIVIISTISHSQDQKPTTKTSKKGTFYAYWGWNRGLFTKSDITFTGNDYDFTLYDVVANDRQSPFEPRIYFHPKNFTIPQYNLRIGYFLNDKYSISLGVDHMKYVMKRDQIVLLSGHISNSGTEYDGDYDKTEIQLKPEFLMFEHTDGLNYLNSEIHRRDNLFEYKKLKLNLITGAGIGTVMPRTNTTLLNNLRYDQFHFAGYGLCALIGINVEFYDRFYIQSELKAGFINMPDIRTTMYTSDRAKQHFSFLQSTVVFGVNLNTKERKK